MEKEGSILIVDDNKDNLKVVSKILSKEAYKLALALDGQTALKILEEIPVDLILLDIMMPGLNGFEVCQIIKNDSRFKDIPVIFFSALNSSEDIVKAFKAGAVDYIPKPFQPEEVKARVAVHMQLQQQKNELLKLNADKNYFISILAHDLKNPFHILLGFCETLYFNVDHYDKEKIKSQVEFIHGSAKKAFNLLESLLTWARSQSGKIPFEPLDLAIMEIFRWSIEETRIMAENKNINIENRLNENIIIHADYKMIITILRNIISNAIKYSYPNGSIILNAEKKDNAVIFSITDNGIGMSQEQVQKLFNISQIKSTTGTNNEKGTGLGLIICKDFVERHGGIIWAESIEGHGSTFKFSIPANV